MTLRIVHISLTPLAGQPYRLVRALQRQTDYDVHLVDVKRWNIYPHDLVFSEEPDQCIETILNADILHFHNYLDLNCISFPPINFNELHAKGKSIICHVHSEPRQLARDMGTSVDHVLSCNLPTLVIAQYPERFFPKARVVQNNLSIEDVDHLPSENPTQWDIFFSPTKKISAWDDRWNTKGTPETYSLMKKIAKETGCQIKVVTKRPLTEVLHEKRRSYIVLDDMITGSYHLSGLEGLSMAKPTLSYLDERIRNVMLDVSGANSIPFINVQLENADTVIKFLLEHRDEGTGIGNSGRQWLEKFWSEESIIQNFKDIYQMLLFDPSLICRQKSLSLENKTQKFFSLTLPDLIYQNRKEQSNNLSYFLHKIIQITINKIKKQMKSLKLNLLSPLLRFLRNTWKLIIGGD